MKKISFYIIFIMIVCALCGLPFMVSCTGDDDDNDNNDVSNDSYPDDFMFIEVPDPLADDNPSYLLWSMDEPAVGQSFTDHHFHTIIKRVSDRSTIRHEYSRYDPYNCDQSLIVLQDTDQGDYMVYRTDADNYVQGNTLVRTLPYCEDPRCGIRGRPRLFIRISLSCFPTIER
jgi:hypothetical protein